MGAAILLIWAAASIIFLAMRLVPSDPAMAPVSNGGVAPTPASVAALHEQLGLGRPVLTVYFDKFAHLLTGDFGRSLQDGSPVAWRIGRRLPRTLELIGLAALLALLFGLPGGLFTAIGRHGPSDRIAMWLSAIAFAVPAFIVGTLLVLLFAETERRVPAGGGYVPLIDDLLPAIALALAPAAIVFRMTRAAVLDVMQRDFVRTARAKGLGSTRILVHHVLRNALIPVMTVLRLHLGTLLGGTVLVEYVFSYPGLGGLLVAAVNARDYPVVEGVVLVILVLFVALNLAVDLLYVLLDPRVRTA